ncbi:VOC family protein [Costertonia aggregata]|uniref:VOC family protein n=1 Tax=Costertonia aggregata TaxID=343403 RepID=A0A7H9ANH8_9FLAO|nr:VOC family protein [Costertonia aggregata]QLG45011.1 VOC family protein [Costertonia aggregata]
MASIKHNLNFSEKDSNIKGFQEVVFSVADMNRWVDFFQHNCGWKLISTEKSSDTLKNMWSLDDSVEWEEAILHNDGDHEGFVRLIQFKNVEQRQIRSATNIWDTGGIFDINMRTPDMDSWYRELQDEGWNGVSEPKRYVFGQYDVSEVLMKGPDGIVIAFMQRFAPPLLDFDHMKKTSRVFNSSVIVSDMAESYDFFINKLGFQMFFRSPGLDRETGHNVIGIPPNVNHEITVPIDIVRPDINNFGSIEYLKTNELKGRDCAEFAKPPNLGILMYRFPVSDADDYAATLVERGLQLNSEVQTVTVPPYGNLKIFSVLSPDGVWLEFIELIE